MALVEEEARAPQKKAEPKIRKNGLCYVCSEPLNEGAKQYGDPFCSTGCCRTYYQVESS